MAMVLLAACGKPAATVTVEQLDGTWLIRTVEGAELPAVDMEEQPNMFFNAADSMFACYVGCNRMGGSLKLGNGGLLLGNVFSTRMYCHGLMELEDRLGALLPQVAKASLTDDGTLSLFDATDTELLTLVRAGEE